MDTPVKEHRVTKHTETILKALISKAELTVDDKAAAVEYVRNNSLAKSKKIMKYASYERLAEILEVYHIDTIELLTAINKYPEHEIKWATDVQSRMAENLDMLNDEKKEKLKALIYASLPVVVREALEENEDSDVFGLRIINVLEQVFNEDHYSRKLFSDLGIMPKFRQNKRDSIKYSCVPHEYMPEIALRTGISLHWMLRWPRPILARTQSTEAVMDLFCFLPSGQQELLQQSLSAAIANGGVEIG